VPLLLPLLLLVTQLTLLETLQAQPNPAVILIFPVPPAAPIEALVGASVYVQATAAADWLTVNSLPAIVRVPLRDVVAVLAATT
jgi:hypothetical protein